MIIEICEDGLAFSDMKVREIAKSAVENNVDISSSNLLLMLAVRAELVKIHPDDRPAVTFIIWGEEIPFDRDVRTSHNYKDTWEEIMFDILNQKRFI